MDLKILLIYVAAMGVTGFILMGADKNKAVAKRWRIPEAVYFVISVLGGSLGCFAGIYVFRHKTRDPKFTVGIPVIIVLQVLLLISLY
ncbi:MAG: DUF1294 domain-containing protein [Clostridia bacterium]|jgi:uncharacterized membrane protein YsdA (DUF1294 family)